MQAADVDQEVMRAKLLAGRLGELLTDTLMTRASIARAIFSCDGLEKMIAAHRAGAKFELEVLGCLLSIERWKQQIVAAQSAHHP